MSIVSAVNTVLSPIISWGVKHLGRLVVQAVPVDIHFCAPPKDDGYGGHIGGSYAIFTLEVINRKQAPVSLTDICCQAFCNDQLLEGGIQCFNNDKHSVSAQARKYQKISILDTLGENSQTITLRVALNEDLSSCNKLVLQYRIGKRNRQVTVWQENNSCA